MRDRLSFHVSPLLLKCVAVWRSWKNRLAAALCTMTLLMTCLSIVRHRHEGDRFHSHAGGRGPSSPHPHSHSHSHSHSHTHHGHAHHGDRHSHTHRSAHRHFPPRERSPSAVLHRGWHLHLMLFGWEITVWERGVEIVRVAGENTERAADTPAGATASPGPEWLTAGGSSWHLLSFVVPLLLPPRRVELPPDDFSTAVSENSSFRARRRERPPVPPPRLTETPTFRR